MSKDTIVWWNSKKLSREYNIHPTQIAILLKKLGAKRWSKSAGNSQGATWYYEIEELKEKVR